MTDTKSTWRKRVALWKASGESASVYGAREGLKPSTLQWWSWRLRRERTSSAASATEAVPMVQLVRAPAASRGAGVAIDLLDARARVVIEPGVDRDTLALVLEMLGVRSAT